jgi:hypothetical protein
LPQELTAAGAQAAAPSQARVWTAVPSPLQTGAQLPSGSIMPAGMGRQVPGVPGRAQLRQGPAQGASQQTPSAQKPLAHWGLAVQAVPGACLPQRLSWQGVPGAHWVASVQELKQSPVAGLQAKGAQARRAPGWHAPAPSQIPEAMAAPGVQLAGLQIVPAG